MTINITEVSLTVSLLAYLLCLACGWRISAGGLWIFLRLLELEINYSNVKIGTQLVKWNTSSENNALVRARITKINEAGSVQGKVNFN